MPFKRLRKRHPRGRRETRQWVNKQPKHLRETCLQSSLIAIVFAMALASLPGHAQNTNHPTGNGASDAIVEQLKRATQELLDAVARGDVAVWRKYLAEDCVYSDEEGNVKTREDLLKELKPLPKNYFGAIVFYQIREFREASSISFLISDATLLENCPFKPTSLNASNVLESAFFKASLNCVSKPLSLQSGLSMKLVGNHGRRLL